MKKILVCLFVFVSFLSYISQVHATYDTNSNLPDLIVKDFSWYPLSPVATYTPNVTALSGYIHGDVIIKNIGNASVTLPEGMNIHLYKSDETNIVGGISLGTENATMNPGETKIYSFTSTSGPNITETPGTFDLTMKVDDPDVNTSSYGLVRESNEYNNTLTKQITIKDDLTHSSSITVLFPNGGESFVAGQSNKISWTGGKTKVKIGLVYPDFRAENSNTDSGSILGWIELNGVPNGSTIWDGVTLKDLSGNKMYFNPGNGNYKIVAVTASDIGNYCTASPVNCSFDLSDDYFTINNSNIIQEDAEHAVTYTSDLTPRISVWSGKVNQHVDVDNKMWNTDPDGVSGEDIDKLTYCKKWYPKTTSVTEYKNETINAWHDKWNVNAYKSTRMTYKCVSSAISIPSITVTSPNGGESYKAGDQITVKWNSSGDNLSKSDKLFISFDKEGKSLLSFDSLNDGIETITIPSGLQSGSYKIRVGSYNATLVTDSSDNTFTINITNCKQISQPTSEFCPNGTIRSVVDTNNCVTSYRCVPRRDNRTITADTITTDTTPIYTAPIKRTLRVGTKGTDVKRLQEFLGITTDGIYGRGTAAEVKAWQQENGLYADGLFGYQSRVKASLNN